MIKAYSAGIITYTLEKNEPIYLVLHYSAGHWEFPKGTMENGETEQETALRELKEETGLFALIDENFLEEIHYIFTDYEKNKIFKTVYFFIGHACETNVILSHEHIGFKWLSYEKALEQLTYDNAKNILEKAHKHLTSA